MDQIKIGKLIAKQRKEKGLTQQELGDKVGVGYRAVSKWETGQTMPDISIINELSQILGITADELLKGELNKQTKTTPKSKKKYLLLLIPLSILILSIVFVIKQNNKVYEYDLVSADQYDCQIEGKLTIIGNTITINIDKIMFNDYDFYSTIIKNYEYRLSSNGEYIVGVGYSDTTDIMAKKVPISEFQEDLKIHYSDRLMPSKENIINNNLMLEFNFVDTADNIINKKIEILIMAPNDDKSTN